MKYPEQILQISVFKALKPLMVLQKYSQFMAFQVRNESGLAGSKGAILGGIAKAMGMMEGASDTIFLFSGKKNPWELGNPKIVFVEFKAYKPLKTKERDPESLMSEAQKTFRDRVVSLGFEYRLIAATDENDALNQTFKILRENGVIC